MKALNLSDTNNIWELSPPFQNYSVLPEDTLILTDLIFQHKSFDTIVCDLIKALDRIGYHDTKYVFIDSSSDSVRLSLTELDQLVKILKGQFNSSICKVLSSNCAFYHGAQPDIVWYPYWLLINEYEQAPDVRKKRIGCLNRKNSPHRVWLMHNLLEQKLIDHDRDIFSMAFLNIYNNQPCNLGSWIDLPALVLDKIKKYPSCVATIDDGFTNDHSISHPAWATAITIVTENNTGPNTILTEKIFKAIAAKCCWISYMGQSGLDALIKLGFAIDTFDQHSTDKNIDPILSVCQELDNESVAFDYYHSKLEIIQHNHDWYRAKAWVQPYLGYLKTML